MNFRIFWRWRNFKSWFILRIKRISSDSVRVTINQKTGFGKIISELTYFWCPAQMNRPEKVILIFILAMCYFTILQKTAFQDPAWSKILFKLWKQNWKKILKNFYDFWKILSLEWAMTRNKTLTFSENFTLTGIAACLSKTTAAPIERVKLLIQNQSELIKQGILDRP